MDPGSLEWLVALELSEHENLKDGLAYTNDALEREGYRCPGLEGLLHAVEACHGTHDTSRTTEVVNLVGVEEEEEEGRLAGEDAARAVTIAVSSVSAPGPSKRSMGSDVPPSSHWLPRRGRKRAKMSISDYVITDEHSTGTHDAGRGGFRGLEEHLVMQLLPSLGESCWDCENGMNDPHKGHLGQRPEEVGVCSKVLSTGYEMSAGSGDEAEEMKEVVAEAPIGPAAPEASPLLDPRSLHVALVAEGEISLTKLMKYPGLLLLKQYTWPGTLQVVTRTYLLFGSEVEAQFACQDLVSCLPIRFLKWLVSPLLASRPLTVSWVDPLEAVVTFQLDPVAGQLKDVYLNYEIHDPVAIRRDDWEGLKLQLLSVVEPVEVTVMARASGGWLLKEGPCRELLHEMAALARLFCQHDDNTKEGRNMLRPKRGQVRELTACRDTVLCQRKCSAEALKLVLPEVSLHLQEDQEEGILVVANNSAVSTLGGLVLMVALEGRSGAHLKEGHAEDGVNP